MGEALERVIRVAFEDLHWADKSSLRLLEALLPLAASDPIASLLLCRRHHVGTSEYVLSFLAQSMPDAHARIRLQPLSTAPPPSSSRTGPAAPRLQSLIAERTEGNPFCVEEMVLTLVRVVTAVEVAEDPGSPYCVLQSTSSI